MKFVPAAILLFISAVSGSSEPALEIDPQEAALGVSFDAVTDVYFRLFTESNDITPQDIYPYDHGQSLDLSNFDPNNPTRILVHGWQNDGDSDFNTVVRNAYFQNGSFNVIVVDWGKGAKDPNYFAARNRVENVGTVTALLIEYLENRGLVDPASIVVVGHSLGAHVSGYAGKALKAGGVATLGAIVGLDPAHPDHLYTFPASRLAKTDAKYVFTIKSSVLGMAGIGKANYVLNNGLNQGGCFFDIPCDHGRAYLAFAEAINTVATATKCDTLNLLGLCITPIKYSVMEAEPLDVTAAGLFNVVTNNQSPLF